MSTSKQNRNDYLFSSLDSQEPITSRKAHIRRLYDVLELCIHRNDLQRAMRAWSILARCKEVQWMSMWTTGLLLISAHEDNGLDASNRLDYLRTMMLRHQDERENILAELVVQLIKSGRHKEALDELELYLPSFPFQDNPVLHIYAALICLYLAQPAELSKLIKSTTAGGLFNSILVREAQSHFQHAQGVDPDNALACRFLEKLPQLCESLPDRQNATAESEDENTEMITADSPRRKRVRT
ncbi:hypothetical protein H0H93_000050 [Arthromyces matolae]|nr:hypothetical protein H0H93_000050 [Arthromyces matolae]